MASEEDKTSPQAVRDLERYEQDLKRDLNGAAKGQMPPNPLLEPLARVSSYWWLELLLGVFWVVIAVVVLKFNHASVTTVGILTGIMSWCSPRRSSCSRSSTGGGRWLWAIFGVLLTAAGIVSLINPRRHVRWLRRHPRVRVPADRRDVDGAGLHGASVQRPVVADSDLEAS